MRMFVIGLLLAYILWQHLGAPAPPVARDGAIALVGQGQALAGQALAAAQTAIPAPQVAVNGVPAALPTAAAAPASEPAPPPPASAPAPAGAFALAEQGPLGCPVAPAAGVVVLTQGYGVGTHAPAAIWGAIDLAVDGDGDGHAEADSSWYAPIVATHDGHVTVTLNSHPAGNHVWVNEPGGVWRTGYSHLAEVTVVSGQTVRAGDQIGLLGSTGMSSGPHLDYQVWRSGVNVDPTWLVGCG